jgi:hypothetical protein
MIDHIWKSHVPLGVTNLYQHVVLTEYELQQFGLSSLYHEVHIVNVIR